MILCEPALDLIFRSASPHNGWPDKPVADETLRALYDLLKWSPTSANSSPARIVFVRSGDAKERLRPALSTGNLEKTMAAPVTAIIGHDLQFHEQLPGLFPHADARSWFAGKDESFRTTAFRNGTLQGAYLIIAARARPGLRANVRFRQRQGRCRVLPGRHGEVELPVQPRQRRCGEALRPQPAAGVR